MTYDEKTKKSHTRSIPSEHKVLIIIELCRNRKSFHGSLTLPEETKETATPLTGFAVCRKWLPGFTLIGCEFVTTNQKPGGLINPYNEPHVQ